MVKMISQLQLPECPHCHVDTPRLDVRTNFQTLDNKGDDQRFWKTYCCARCGGVVMAYSYEKDGDVYEMYPNALLVSEAIPEPAKEYLKQAIRSQNSPVGSVMVSASAVDAMLKAKDYKEGSLFTRIDKAAKDHLITDGMAEWAHNVRLDANEQRHADENVQMPTPEDARLSIDFALALGEFLFVLPSKVTKGIKESEPPSEEAKDASE